MTQQDVAAAELREAIEALTAALHPDRRNLANAWVPGLGQVSFGQLRLILSALQQRSGAVERERVAEAALEPVVNAVLDAAHDYVLLQYGIGALRHPADRARIIAKADAILGGQS